MSFNDKIKTAKLPYTTVPICLDSSLVFEYGQAVAALLEHGQNERVTSPGRRDRR